MDCMYIAIFYSWSTQSALRINASDIYPFIHRWQRLLSKLPTCTSGAVGVQCLAQGHFDTWQGGVGTNHSIAKRLYLLNHYRPQLCMSGCE